MRARRQRRIEERRQRRASEKEAKSAPQPEPEKASEQRVDPPLDDRKARELVMLALWLSASVGVPLRRCR
jgi:hypothetical protein